MHRVFVAGVAGLLGVAVGAGGAVAMTGSSQPHQQSLLLARSVLAAASERAGSPPSGAYLGAADRATARANGVTGPDTGPYFAHQPVQGTSALIPARGGDWWALTDNGYGTRQTSADWQLAIYRMDLRFGTSGSPVVESTVLLSDPGRHVPWKIATGDAAPTCRRSISTPCPPRHPAHAGEIRRRGF